MDSDHESVSIWEDEYEFGDGNGNRNDHPHSNISRLSMCSSSTSTTVYGHGDDEDDDSMMRMFMSRLSMKDDQGYGDHGDADADVDEEFKDEGKLEISGGLFSKYDYDKEPLGLGLLATPPRWRNHRSQQKQKQIEGGLQGVAKEYCTSENEAHDRLSGRRRRRRGRGRRRRSRVVMIRDDMSCNSSEGGRRWRCLCMGLEEVKACSCRDLIGYHLDLDLDLEHHHRHTPTPLHSRTSTPSNTNSSSLFVSGYSTLDTASGPNSPISNWRICSPGDDPRDVKARLRVWAQAVALASSSMSRHPCT